MKLTLKSFIVNRVLADPATLAKYTNGLCKVPSGNFEKKYKAEMRILTLRRLLTLILFLDRAKEANLLDRVPMLFSKGSKVKSTREVLIRLCRDFLSAEGDIIKHLSRIGITVSYKQTAVDEVDYTVKNLAVDLRDGVRLGRVTEILTCQEPKSILVKLRLPAVSRLQKLHNVGSVLTILRDYGVPSLDDVAPHHIVDGHREMVLKLMWSVLAYCGLRTILNAEAIEDEIQNVLRANSSRRPRWKLGLDSAAPQDVPDNTSRSGQEAFYRSLLLRWVNAICSCFGRTASDFSSSFADGTVLCLLIHYYHPGHLPLSRIQPTTQHIRTDDNDLRAQALLRETSNFELAQATISELGGVPKMIPTANTDNRPEENSMFLSVAYLCSRLMESSKEILACIRIQTCYCRYKRRIELEKKLVAAAFILKSWREHKDQYFANQRHIYQGPVFVIESFLLSVKDQLYEMRRKRLRKEATASAATLIQVHFRWCDVLLLALKQEPFSPHVLLFESSGSRTANDLPTRRLSRTATESSGNEDPINVALLRRNDRTRATIHRTRGCCRDPEGLEELSPALIVCVSSQLGRSHPGQCSRISCSKPIDATCRGSGIGPTYLERILGSAASST